MSSISASTGLTLPGMMLDPGCTAGRRISSRPVVGPDDSRRKSLAMRTSVTASGAQRRREVGRRRPCAASISNRLSDSSQLQPGQFAQPLDHARVIFGVGVQPGAGSRAADAAAGADRRRRAPCARGRAPRPWRSRRTPGPAAPARRPASACGPTSPRRRTLPPCAPARRQPSSAPSSSSSRHRAAQADGGGDGVVGGLRHVDVVVGADQVFCRADRPAFRSPGWR